MTDFRLFSSWGESSTHLIGVEGLKTRDNILTCRHVESMGVVTELFSCVLQRKVVGGLECFSRRADECRDWELDG